MKRILLLSIVAVFTAMASLAIDEVKEPDWGRAEIAESYMVGPGIHYQKILFREKPLILWFAEVDLSNPYNKVEQVESRNSVPDVARWDLPTFYNENSHEGHHVKLAWNHDFFSYDGGMNIGNNISNGQMTRTPWGRSMLGISKDKKAEVFYPAMDLHLTAADGTIVNIDYFNSSAWGTEGDCVYFNTFNSRTVGDDGLYISVQAMDEWTVNGDDIRCKVLEVSESPLQTSTANDVILLRGSKRHAWDGHVQAGDVITVTQRFTSNAWGRTAPAYILNGFHGYPSIVHDGKFHDGEYNDFENGREYEKSSRVMAGISQDKTKLYIVTTEMSTASQAVDCVELASWMVLHGAWDVVNFDSGGSATICMDAEMLNVPGRGAVRPVRDALIAVSLAPTDKDMHHLAFSKEEIGPTVISLTPLRVMGYNQYDEILEKDLKGCSFTCEPAELGYVDDEAMFHSGAKAVEGKIIATKDGLTAELPVKLQAADTIYSVYDKYLVDAVRKPLVQIYGESVDGKFALDPTAFAWTSTDNGVATIENGCIVGHNNGVASLHGEHAGISLDIEATVEIAPEEIVIDEMTDISHFDVAKSGATNITLNSNAELCFDKTSSRAPYIKLTMNKRLYSLPDSLGIQLDDPEGLVTNMTFMMRDNQGTAFNVQVDAKDSRNGVFMTRFLEDSIPYGVERYPLSLLAIKFGLNTMSGTGKVLPLRNFKAYYPSTGQSGINDVAVATASRLTATVADGCIYACYTAEHNELAKVELWSTTGMQLATKAVMLTQGTNELTLPAITAAPGVYIVTLTTGNKQEHCKVIVR
ncbi:MAG: phosphodiester glycosidase family protein [Bacteroidales bacterium]|nr:phosphodiester glycosidase family protein [Candidatus Sodaliphilus fimicaballi]